MIYRIQIQDRISLQYARNANERKTETKRTKNEQTLHTNDTKNARCTKRIYDTRNVCKIHKTNARYTNESLERTCNHILFNDKRSWFYRGTI